MVQPDPGKGVQPDALTGLQNTRRGGSQTRPVFRRGIRQDALGSDHHPHPQPSPLPPTGVLRKGEGD